MRNKQSQLKLKIVLFVLFLQNAFYCHAFHQFTTEEVENGKYLFYTTIDNLKVGFNEGWICDGNNSSDFGSPVNPRV